MSSDSRSVLVHTSRTPSICGIDGCECCPPGAVYCDCHESYNDVEAEPVVAMWGWDCACGAAPPRRWADYWECIAAGHAHQIEDHGRHPRAARKVLARTELGRSQLRRIGLSDATVHYIVNGRKR